MRKLILLTVLGLSGCGFIENASYQCKGSDIEMGCNTLFGYQDNTQDKQIETIINTNKEQARQLNELIKDNKEKDRQILDLISKNSDQDNSINNINNNIAQIVSDNEQIKTIIESNSNDIELINTQLGITSSTITLIQALLPSLASQSQIDALNTQLNLLTIQYNTLVTTDIDLQTQINALQNTINSNIEELAVLQGYNNIVSLLDPCGNQAGYDEVFLRLSSGQILSSFSENSSGLNTRFSVIEPSDSNVFSTTDHTSCTFKVFATGPKANKVCFGNGYNTCI